MSKNAVRVSVRLRPTDQFAPKNVIVDEGCASIDLKFGKEDHGVNNSNGDFHFVTDAVYQNISQEQIFDKEVSDIISAAMEGYNGTVMCYGQTGAGKTFTMCGNDKSFEHRGIIPRAIARIFQEVDQRPESLITVKISYLEIYNEAMFDLFSENEVGQQSGEHLGIYEDPKTGSTIVKNLARKTVATEHEALTQYFVGSQYRVKSNHALNEGSTRSHCIFTIHIESRSKVESSEKIIHSKVHLVDLAGSERVKKTGSEGLTLKEAGFINKSLSYLEQVVLALGDKSRDHCPYRQSKLTNLLKDSIGGNCKTNLIINVWPEARHLDETCSALRFATRAMKVSNAATVNVSLEPALLIKKYEKDIRQLKQELLMHNTIAGRAKVNYDAFSRDELLALEDTLKDYVDGNIQEMSIDSIQQCKESFGILRKMINTLQEELKNRPTQAEAEAALEEAEAAAKAKKTIGQGEGEDGPSTGLTAGFANADSKPPAADEEEDFDQDYGETAAPELGQTKLTAPDKNEAYHEFIGSTSSVGGALLGELKILGMQQKDRKLHYNQIVQQMNKLKSQIDTLTHHVKNKQADRNPDAMNNMEVIDEEEFAYYQEREQCKSQYKQLYEDLNTCNHEMHSCSEEIQHKKHALYQAFNDWYEDQYGAQALARAANGASANMTADFQRLNATILMGADQNSLEFHRAHKDAAKILSTRQKH